MRGKNDRKREPERKEVADGAVDEIAREHV